jgi:dTDP-4-amino-4,6-dideoxygalactose transaminase
MIPLTRPTLPKSNFLNDKIKDVFKTGMLTESKFTREFESRCAKFLHVKHVIAVSSGTNALLLTLRCLGLKGEVILPSFTFTSDGHVLLWSNLKPVFVDIDPSTFNIDPSFIEKKITKNTSAIMPTHVFGAPCDIKIIQKIAKKYNLKVLYDGAHAFGSQYNGQFVARFGDATIYSLTPTKVLTTGEGGLVATNNTKLAEKLKLAKHNGDSFNRKQEFLGLSSRMPELSAILGIENLKIFKKSIKQRLKAVEFYKKELSSIKGIKFQRIFPNTTSVYKDLTILINRKEFGASRDELLQYFLKNRVETKVYFDPPLHKKRVYNKEKTFLPQTEFVSKNIINLPLYAHMTKKEIRTVCNLIKELHR